LSVSQGTVLYAAQKTNEAEKHRPLFRADYCLSFVRSSPSCGDWIDSHLHAWGGRDYTHT